MRHDEQSPLLTLDHIVKEYAAPGSLWRGGGGGVVRALDGVSLSVRAGETVAIVGESGSGKSTLLRLSIGVEMPTTGSVRHDDRDLREFDRQAWRQFRVAVQPVFQDPSSSLNPRMRVVDIVAEPLRCLLGLGGREALQRARLAIEAWCQDIAQEWR